VTSHGHGQVIDGTPIFTLKFYWTAAFKSGRSTLKLYTGAYCARKLSELRGEGVVFDDEYIGLLESLTEMDDALFEYQQGQQ
jgi:hypothetical protein